MSCTGWPPHTHWIISLVRLPSYWWSGLETPRIVLSWYHHSNTGPMLVNLFLPLEKVENICTDALYWREQKFGHHLPAPHHPHTHTELPEIDTEQGPVVFLGTKPFCVPHFFDYRKQPSFSLHHLPWVPMGRSKQVLIREGRGCETREKQSRAALGQGPVSPSTIHTTISLSYFADTETPSR